MNKLRSVFDILLGLSILLIIVGAGFKFRDWLYADTLLGFGIRGFVIACNVLIITKPTKKWTDALLLVCIDLPVIIYLGRLLWNT